MVGFSLGASLLLMVWHIRQSARVYMVSDVLFFISIGLLVAGTAGVVGNSGAFDIVAFSTRRVLAIITNKQPEDEEAVNQTFADYVSRSRQKHQVRPLLISGSFCLLASLLAAAVSL